MQKLYKKLLKKNVTNQFLLKLSAKLMNTISVQQIILKNVKDVQDIEIKLIQYIKVSKFTNDAWNNIDNYK